MPKARKQTSSAIHEAIDFDVNNSESGVMRYDRDPGATSNIVSFQKSTRRTNLQVAINSNTASRASRLKGYADSRFGGKKYCAMHAHILDKDAES